MSLKLKAFTKTSGMFAVSSLVALSIVWILNNVPQDWIPVFFIIFLVGFLFWVAYSFNLAQLKAEEKLKEISEKYSKNA